MKIKINVLAMIAVLLAGMASAMPTAEEIAAVKPLVAELMKPDMDAMKLGRKSKVDVAKSAMQLIAQADTPAAKMLLARGAFQNFVKGGDYEAAEKALDALLKAVPDYPTDEQQELLEKALYPLPLKKAPQLRARLADVKQRASSAVQVRKIKAMLEKSPDDPALHLRLATAYALQDDWPNAVAAFAKSSDAALVQAAKAELDSTHPPAKTADLWWSVELPKSSARLASAIRSHAAVLYTKALPALSGLAKVQAERRIQEASAAESAGDNPDKSSAYLSAPSVGTAKYYGVELVGGSVKENKGILSGFANNSYAKLRMPFNPQSQAIEAVVEFETGQAVDKEAGLLCTIQKCGFAPFYILSGQLTSWLSTNGETWDVASGIPVGPIIQVKTTYRVKVVGNGKDYSWYLWENNRWQRKKSIVCSTPIFCGTGLLMGTNRLFGTPFSGTIDLNKCYICIGGKLWWEGVKGAYKNANR